MIGYPDLEFWNNPPTYDFDAYGIPFFMMLDSVRIDPLDFLVLLKNWVAKKNVLLRDF